MTRAWRLITPMVAGALLTTLGATPASGQPPSGPEQSGRALCPMPAEAQVPGFVSETDPVIYITADQGASEQGKGFQLRGDVQLEQAGRRITAEEAAYDRESGHISIKGRVHYQEPSLDISGEGASFNADNREGRIRRARYQALDVHVQGEAEEIVIEDGQRLRLQGASYTTCPPQQEDWRLRVSRLSLDRAANEAEATHVRLELLGTPVFYFPYLNFPLGQRKSGLLIPSYGSSRTGGTDITLPWYWNIAPNRDATFTPRYTSQRGAILGGEYRYLNRTNQGQLYVEYMPYDDVRREDRGRLMFQHGGWLNRHWRSALNVNSASDENYLRELGQRPGDSSARFLERRADFIYHSTSTALQVRGQDFQILDSLLPAADQPYRRLPQLGFQYYPVQPMAGLLPQIEAEYVNFERDLGVTGQRLDAQLALSHPWQGAAGFLTPRVSVRHTRYTLANTAPAAPAQPSRTVPGISVDGGLFYDRDTTLGGHGLVQTLEPRLFYLYVPYRDQQGLIRDESGKDVVFDSGLPDFSFVQLFRYNRYIGADRVADANQLSAALTTRVLEGDSGVERLSAALGVIHYFQPSRVTLPGETALDQSSSDWLVQVYGAPLRYWRVGADLQWDPYASEVVKSRIRFGFELDRARTASLAFSQRRQELEQTDLALRWQLSTEWSMMARWRHSLTDNRALETLSAVEYNSCCWLVRVGARRYVNDISGGTDTALALQLELKGLGNLGSKMFQ